QSGSDSSMRLDKLCRINPTARVLAITGPDERREELAHFKMEMREIAAIGGADGCDLLTALHGFAGMHQHVLQVPIVRLHIFAFTVFEIGVKQDDDVTPAGTAIARKQRASVSDHVNRIAEIAVLAADSI